MSVSTPWRRVGALFGIAGLALVAACSTPGSSSSTGSSAGASTAGAGSGSPAAAVSAQRAQPVTPALTATGPKGEKITVSKPVERIVCITGICDDIAAALKITPVGTSTPGVAGLESHFGARAKEIPVIPGSFGSEDVEAIARLKPDLVIGLGGVHEKLAPALGKFTTFLTASPNSHTDSVGYLRLVATLASKPAEQVAAEQRFHDAIANAKRAIAGKGADTRVLAMWGSANGAGVEVAPGSVTGSVLKESTATPSPRSAATP